ncbi:glycosyltransferase family 4 protein [Nocardioides houyundeii]|uniref:glycosyltransferase family 4 protein n=1 Tax=Nocardioides houyundeii TaxID=2045452 RepID=UPI000DF1ECB4|nr:glycosyltransferase family 4 protein [Nocardioides houyundeii]
MTIAVTFVCQWFPPEPAAVPESIAHALRDQGLRVEVLTGIPNYPTGIVAEGYAASRAVSEVQHGIRVRRTPLYPSHDTSAVKRLLNYASWALSSAVLGQKQLRKADANLVYSSPATAAFPAMVAKTLWRTPYVLLVQDVWPDSIFASGFLSGRLSQVIFRMVDTFVRCAYSMADHVAVISPGMADLLIERGVPSDKVSVVYNWLPEGDSAVDEGATSSVREDLGIPDDAKLFLYAGNHGRAQALDSLVDAFMDPATAPAHLVLLGDGVSKPDLVRRAAGKDRLHFLDPVPREEAVRMSRASDVHVVSLADDPLFAVTMPSKVQSGLATGLPVLVVAPGDSAAVVTGECAGLAASPGDVAAVVEAVSVFNEMTQKDLAKMGERGREAYERLMARGIGAARLAFLLQQAALRRGTRSMATATAVSNEGEKL